MKPYKQSFTHSCLVADLLMLSSKSEKVMNKKTEEEILINGMDRKYGFYMVGMITEFFNKTKEKSIMFVDNKYFTGVLAKLFKKEVCDVIHNKIDIKLIKENLPAILHIDDNYFGDYSHASHFIVIEESKESKFSFIDPMSGKRGSISQEKLMDSINSLKKHIKMCPLLIRLK